MDRAARTATLLEKLVDLEALSSLPPAVAAKHRADLVRYCARLLSSRLSASASSSATPLQEQRVPNHPTLSETGEFQSGLLAEELCRSVRRVVQSRDDRAKCDELVVMLLGSLKGRLNRPGAAVKLLCLLGNSRQEQSLMIQSQTAGGIRSIVEQRDDEESVKILEKAIGLGPDQRLDEVKASQPMDAALRQRIVKAKETEALLVREVLFAWQGIDGHLIKFSEKTDAHTVSPIRTISEGMRRLVHKLCEVGWLYRRVDGFIRDNISQEKLGLVSQTFSSALQTELTEYFRLIAVLESQVSNNNTNTDQTLTDLQDVGPPLKLTLRQLAVWAEEPTRRLQLMAEIAETVQGLIGGALASVVHVHSMHGDPFVCDFAEGILQKVSAPIFESIRLWVMYGELEDPCSEFFVSADHSVSKERLWFDKYKLRSSMIPSFIERNLAKKILLVGKSINFIRDCCSTDGGRSPLDDEAISVENEFALLQVSEHQDQQPSDSKHDEELDSAGIAYEKSGTHRRTILLLRAIDRAAESTNQRLLSILFNQYKLLYHCRAIKQYLLLGQGDMIQYLMDLLSPQLSLPAGQVYRHTLVAQLETAVRASNPQAVTDDILNHLDVKLLQVSPGDSGWDVFVLDYTLTPPLNCVITTDAMSKYYEIFTFLWRLKRVEYSLSSAWKQEMTSEHVVREMTIIHGTLHKFHILRNEMIHFVSNLHSYIMFEVLETSWEELVRDFEAAKDLDQVVQAHENYLSQIMQKSLIGTATQLESEMGISPVPVSGSPSGFPRRDNKISSSSAATSSSSYQEPDANSLRQGMQNLFDLVLRFCNVQKRLYTSVLEQVHKLQRTRFQIIERTRNQKWGIDESDASHAESTGTFADPEDIQDAEARIAAEYNKHVLVISNEYKKCLREFLDCLKPTSSENLKFLRFRLDFNLYYEMNE